jgi:hypothetical protein
LNDEGLDYVGADQRICPIDLTGFRASGSPSLREGIGVGSNLPKNFDKNFSKTQINALKTREFWRKKYFVRKNA